MSLLDQLPRLSAYDPGAAGEGGLDPLGLGAIADRIANVLAPGVRARMSQPRFVALSALGSVACQSLHGLSADEGKTTVDIAFEWLVVEAMVRYPGDGRAAGLPGNQKAARAKQMGERLSRRTYLNGPRVFGFTGVYRPFSRDAGVLTDDDLPGSAAERLIAAWERDSGRHGYLSGDPESPGGRLRAAVAEVCRRSLEKGGVHCSADGIFVARSGGAPSSTGAGTNERRELRSLITASDHVRRNELTARLAADPPPEGVTDRDLAFRLLPGLGAPSRRALQAAIDYETVATALDNGFRRFLSFTTQQHGAVISRKDALQTPQLAELAPKVGHLVQRALDAVAQLDDPGLVRDAEAGLRLFSMSMTPDEFFEALVHRHDEVQSQKSKLSWLEQLGQRWTVRVPYRRHYDYLDDEVWAHPMRLVTLANFLSATA